MVAQKWSEDREARLVELWDDEAMSATMIAAEMGITRCAVLGKAHRMKLPSRKETHRSDAVRLGLAPKREKKPRRQVVINTGHSNIAMLPRSQDLAAEQRQRALARGYSKSSPSYRAMFGVAPEMTPNQRRQFLADAMRNTAAMQAAGS